MKFILASSNMHKKSEYERLLSPHSVYIEESFTAEETGKTYEENAFIKLDALYFILKNKGVELDENTVLIADDSGLEVPSLPSILGLYTSRFMEGEKQSKKNRAVVSLLDKSALPRSARFVCTIAYSVPFKNIRGVVEGELKGSIAKIESGSTGFGYDPIFVPDGEIKTLSLLGEDYKNTHSHRYRATEKLLKALDM